MGQEGHILILTGWGQNIEILQNIFAEDKNLYIDYMQYDYDQLKQKITKLDFDIVIGWSLGGQLAVRLINDLDLHNKVKKVFLLATPYNFVNKLYYGVGEEIFLSFVNQLKADKNKLEKKFWNLINLGNKKDKYIFKISNYEYKRLNYWLNILYNFNGDDYICDIKTYIFHGLNDKVVDYRQANFWMKKCKLPNLYQLNNSSHIPNKKDAIIIKELIYNN